MDTKAKGIVIFSKDYKDNDKLALIFTDEFGLINAKFTGIKKAKAKLKAVGQAFCYADFSFNKAGNFYFVKTANIIDSHINILSNYNAMQAGFIALEILEKLLPKEKQENDIFSLLLATLQELNNGLGFDALIRFVIYLCKILGNPILTDSIDISKPVYLDSYEGTLSSIKTANMVLIDKKVYTTLDDCLHYKDATNSTKIIQAIKLLSRCLLIKFDITLKSIDLI